MDLQVKDLQGQFVRTIQVEDSVFGVPFNEALVHQVMVAHQANRRVGTHSTRTRGEVRGGGRKPYSQKHTGRARQGSTRSPQWRGGGVVFGPHPRDYHQRTPKKMRRGAFRCMLAQRVREGRVTVVEDLGLQAPKTKEMIQLLKGLGIETRSLVVSVGPSLQMRLACGNLADVKSLPANTLGTMDLLEYGHLLINVPAVRQLEELCATRNSRLELAVVRNETLVEGEA